MTQTRIVLSLALRAAVLFLLAGGLLWTAGSDADVVATIAATVIMVAPMLSGAVLIWLGSIARIDAHRSFPWLLAQGAVVLVIALAVPVVAFPAPLIESATVLWVFAGLALVSGAFEMIGGALGVSSRIAGAALLGGAVLLGVLIILKEDTHLLALMGPSGLIIGLIGIGMAGAAVRAGMRPDDFLREGHGRA